MWVVAHSRDITVLSGPARGDTAGILPPAVLHSFTLPHCNLEFVIACMATIYSTHLFIWSAEYFEEKNSFKRSSIVTVLFSSGCASDLRICYMMWIYNDVCIGTGLILSTESSIQPRILFFNWLYADLRATWLYVEQLPQGRRDALSRTCIHFLLLTISRWWLLLHMVHIIVKICLRCNS